VIKLVGIGVKICEISNDAIPYRLKCVGVDVTVRIEDVVIESDGNQVRRAAIARLSLKGFFYLIQQA
jgi:hypothetical protein